MLNAVYSGGFYSNARWGFPHTHPHPQFSIGARKPHFGFKYWPRASSNSSFFPNLGPGLELEPQPQLLPTLGWGQGQSFHCPCLPQPRAKAKASTTVAASWPGLEIWSLCALWPRPEGQAAAELEYWTTLAPGWIPPPRISQTLPTTAMEGYKTQDLFGSIFYWTNLFRDMLDMLLGTKCPLGFRKSKIETKCYLTTNFV